MASPFFGNYYCLIPGTSLAFVAISKNAVTYLKKVALFQTTREWVTSDRQAHHLIGYDVTSPYLVPVDRMDAYEAQHGARRRFAVWRDPVRRIESTYALFCLQGEPRTYFHLLALDDRPTFERFLQVARWEWGKPDPLDQDEHLRRQVDYVDPAALHDVVALPRLNDYLAGHGLSAPALRANQSTAAFRVEDPAHVAEIKERYAADYSIEVTVQ